MKYLIILAVITLFGCNNDTPPSQKPFIIVEKYTYNRCLDHYRFIDKNGVLSEYFTDDPNKYSF